MKSGTLTSSRLLVLWSVQFFGCQIELMKTVPFAVAEREREREREREIEREREREKESEGF
jgi:hypothetical protein